ncbi:hypothetical protein AL059_17145 [Pseudomonas syringae pv. papulans]|nr:hypothetical protein AL059_17145 [Pseudomonas syringae pv. papulans]
MMIIKICLRGYLTLAVFPLLENITTKMFLVLICLRGLQMSEAYALPLGPMTGQVGLFPVSMQAMRGRLRYLIHLTDLALLQMSLVKIQRIGMKLFPE